VAGSGDSSEEKGYSYLTQLEIISSGDVQKIHTATLQVLEEVGVEVHHDKVLGALDDNGARVDHEKKRVRFPDHVLETLIHRAPSQFTWHGRDPDKSMVLGDGSVHFGSGHMQANVIDLNGVRRPSTLRDAENLARIVDSLEHADEGCCIALPQDVPHRAAYAYYMLTTIKYSTKPFRSIMYGREQSETTIRMAAAVAGGMDELRKRPLVVAIHNPISPLTFYHTELEGLLVYTECGLPVIMASEVQAGATGPVTLAGTIVQHNAEVLSGIAIVQALNPGNPVVYGQVSGTFDMKDATFSYGSIEHGMLNVVFAQLARYYGLPSRGDAGTTDSKSVDVQSGFESAWTVALAALGGQNYIFGAVSGMLESTLTASYEKLIIDNEIVGNVKRLIRGIEVNDDTLAFDVIKSVGPGKDYLGHPHTLKYFRTEQFLPELVDRKRYSDFRDDLIVDVRARAKEKAEALLEKHWPEPLDEGMVRELEGIVEAVEREE
jgi:trimethylamine--corrinoid protein Co-methyltransferase